jgi:nucleoside-diphosphate-sugar epimerase
VLITGSNGFIGDRIAVASAERGWDVVGLGRAAGARGPVASYVRHDVREPLAFTDRVDAVVHCAALASPWARPSAFAETNVNGTRHVVDWCVRNGRPHLVLVSSTSVLYRHADQLGLTEDAPAPPEQEQINAYSRSKLAAERLAGTYPGRWTVLRPRAVFGPGDTTLLPRVLAVAGRGVLPVLESARGRPVVCDLSYVDTIAQYAVAAIARAAAGVYNLTNGEPVALYPFLLGVLRRLGYAPSPRRVPLGTAMALAGAGELVSARLLGYREPPLTRFGVSMLGYSRTFDPAKCRRDLGPPAVSVAEGVDRLVCAHARNPPPGPRPAAGT